MAAGPTERMATGSDGDRTDEDVVAMDTSALMAPVECDVRVFDEFDRLLAAPRPVVPAPVVEELDRLAEGAGTAGTAAGVGRELVADRCRVVETEAVDADDALVELARNGTVDYVATNDRPLADRVLAADVPVIGLRGRNKLAVTQP